MCIYTNANAGMCSNTNSGSMAVPELTNSNHTWRYSEEA